MTLIEHMNKVAERYAAALVRWHLDKNDQEHWNQVCEMQELLNDLAIERSQEILEEA